MNRTRQLTLNWDWWSKKINEKHLLSSQFAQEEQKRKSESEDTDDDLDGFWFDFMVEYTWFTCETATTSTVFWPESAYITVITGPARLELISSFRSKDYFTYAEVVEVARSEITFSKITRAIKIHGRWRDRRLENRSRIAVRENIGVLSEKFSDYNFTNCARTFFCLFLIFRIIEANDD